MDFPDLVCMLTSFMAMKFKCSLRKSPLREGKSETESAWRISVSEGCVMGAELVSRLFHWLCPFEHTLRLKCNMLLSF